MPILCASVWRTVNGAPRHGLTFTGLMWAWIRKKPLTREPVSWDNWIYGAGQQYASFPSFQQLEKSHQAMHAHIGKIIQLKEIGDNISAETNLDELERLSREVVDAINEMETHLAEVSGSRSVQANHLPDSVS